LHAEDAKASLFFFLKKKHCQGSSAGSMEPSLPVKASLLVAMADHRIVIKEVKKGHAYTESRPTHHR